MQSNTTGLMYPPLPRSVSYILLALALLKLWLVAAQTVSAIGYFGHDDRLFLVLAKHIAQFEWLGPYNNLTLAKGPFYPIWIALSFLLGVPLLLSQHLLYIFASLVAVLAVRPLIGRGLAVVLVFAFLLFNPMSFSDPVMTRILRSGIYPALTLLCVAFAIGFLLRINQSRQRLFLWTMACGLSLSMFWLTREEGIWIMPVILPIFSWAVYLLLKAQKRDWVKVSFCLVPLLSLFLFLQLISITNKVHYGEYAVVEFKTPEFVAAYGALTRVRHKHWKQKVPVPIEVRQRIYSESDAFAELAPSFERNNFWNLRRLGQTRHPGWPDEIGSAWFMWALRDAVGKAGYYRDASTAAAFYGRLANEINRACMEGRLDCLEERATMMPPWRDEYLKPWIASIGSGFDILWNLRSFTPVPRPTRGSDESLVIFRDMTREQLSPQREKTDHEIIVRGWSVHTSKSLTVSLYNEKGDLLVTSVVMNSPKVKRYFQAKGKSLPYMDKARFELKGACYPNLSKCHVVVEAGDKVLARFPLREGETQWSSNPLWIYVDFIGPPSAARSILPLQHKVDKIKLGVLEWIGSTYQRLLIYLAMLALLIYAFETYRVIRRRSLTALWIITSGLAAAVATLIIALALIHVTSFYGLTLPYLSPAMPLFLLLVALLLAAPFTERYRKNATT